MNVPRWHRLYAWWIALTALYLVAEFAQLRADEFVWVGSLGLFVPIALGVLSGIFVGLSEMVSEGSILGLILLLPIVLMGLALWFDSWIVKSWRIGALTHIVINLALLFVVTAITDYLIVQDWMSMGAFLQSIGVASPFVSHFSM